MSIPATLPESPDRLTSAADEFFQLLSASLAAEPPTFVKLGLGKYRGSEAGLSKIAVRLLTVKDKPHLSFTYNYLTKDVTKNYSIADGLARVQRYMNYGEVDAAQGDGFKSGHLRLQDEEIQLLYNKKNEPSLQRTASKPAQVISTSHDREKYRYIDIERPFLHSLGVTDARLQLIPAMSRKWKQINKFLEVFQHAFETLKLPQTHPVHVVDFGAGKGYLTFAIHDFLRETLGYQTQVTGVELREELVNLCSKVVSDLSLTGLEFYQGDVRSYHPAAVDVMIALHACDIATDYALHTGIRLGASIIMCAPCCHKQVRPQMQSPAVLRPMLQHGVHMGQEAEMLTDGLRALLLEASGYETKVFEFVSLEHTSKNKMILAIKRDKNGKQAEVLKQIAAIKAFYGIKEQCLETLLVSDGLI